MACGPPLIKIAHFGVRSLFLYSFPLPVDLLLAPTTGGVRAVFAHPLPSERWHQYSRVWGIVETFFSRPKNRRVKVLSFV